MKSCWKGTEFTRTFMICNTPDQQTLNRINGYFGSFPAFHQQFTNAAIKVEGSGWAILTWQRLEILQAEKHSRSRFLIRLSNPLKNPSCNMHTTGAGL